MAARRLFSIIDGRLPGHAMVWPSTFYRERCETYEGLEMKKIALIFVVVAAVTLPCATAISNAQDRESPHAAVPQMEGMHRGEGPRKGDRSRSRHRVLYRGGADLPWPCYGSYIWLRQWTLSRSMGSTITARSLRIIIPRCKIVRAAGG